MRAGGGQPDPYLDRRGQGARPRDPRARGPAERLRRARADDHRLDCRPDGGDPRATSVEEINSAFERLADHQALEGILAYTEDPIVSSDIVKSSYSSILDPALTSVVDGTQVKVVAWYNERVRRCPSRLVDLAQRVVVPVAQAV